ncbi:MAG: right-handed parallel beta-helix repeat-containing protein [Oscillospiraceae bacterium]|jgi:hypothetical protein|nr:right-handed parallel beta-helix repeat-containing protein [Oscillospiraceae bacterium]
MNKQILTILKQRTSFVLVLMFTFSLIFTYVPASAKTDFSEWDSLWDFPYELGEPHVEEGGYWARWGIWDNYWLPPADFLILEYSGIMPTDYAFMVSFGDGTHMTYVDIDKNRESQRITEVSGKITVDLRGLGFRPSGFYFKQDYLDRIDKIYLDEDTTPNPSPKIIYVDSANASKGDGSESNPFMSLDDAMKSARGSDMIILADGIYHGVFEIPSGTPGMPTIFRAAENAKPVITTSISLNTTWSVHDGSIYVTDLSDVAHMMDTHFPQLFVDGISMVEARYPNLPGSDMSYALEQERFFASEGTNNSRIVMQEELPFDLTGATVLFWPGAREHGEPAVIASVSGATVTFETPHVGIDHIGAQSDTNLIPGNPFFLVRTLSLLDAPGEYYYDEQEQLMYFYPPNGDDPGNLTLSLKSNINMYRGHALYMYGNTIVEGIHAYSGGIYAIGENNTIESCVIRYTDHFYGVSDINYYVSGVRMFNGITMFGTDGMIRNNIVGPTAGNGIVAGGKNIIITNNYVHDVCYSGHWQFGIAIAVRSENYEISHNSIINGGRDLISGTYFWGHDFTQMGDGTHADAYVRGGIIRNNHVKNPMMLTSDGGAIVSPFTDGGGAETYHNFIEADARRADHHVKGIYVDSAGVGDPIANYIYHQNIIVGIAGGMTALMPNMGIQLYNNTVIDANVGFTTGYLPHSEHLAKDLVFKDNLFVDVDNDHGLNPIYDIRGMQYGQFADTNGVMPFPNADRDGVVSYGNTRGTVDDQFRPSGDTPNVGAVLHGEEMFEYGVTWNTHELPPRNITIPDYFNSDQNPQNTPNIPDNDATKLPIIEDEVNSNLILWIIIGTFGIAVLVIVAIVIKTKTVKK